jgi:hypothetical protein
MAPSRNNSLWGHSLVPGGRGAYHGLNNLGVILVVVINLVGWPLLIIFGILPAILP